MAGDFIIKYVKGWEFSNSKQNIAANSFSGATVEDINDFLKPKVGRQPDKQVIHVGRGGSGDDQSDHAAKAKIGQKIG